MKTIVITSLLLALTACQVSGPSLAGYDGLQTDIMWHYRTHAVEENGSCRLPEMRAITQSEVIEDSADKLVLKLRYRYLDTSFRNEKRQALIGNCDGFGTRQFTIAKLDNGLKVQSMSGPTR